MTNSARLHLNPDLPARWLDDFFVNELEGTFCLFDSNGFHVFVSTCSSIGCDQDYPRINLKSRLFEAGAVRFSALLVFYVIQSEAKNPG